jgi:hypothetical protein
MLVLLRVDDGLPRDAVNTVALWPPRVVAGV